MTPYQLSTAISAMTVFLLSIYAGTLWKTKKVFFFSIVSLFVAVGAVSGLAANKYFSFLVILLDMLIVVSVFFLLVSFYKTNLQQKKQLETIIEHMSDQCIVVDRTGRHILVNKAAKDLLPDIEIKQIDDWLEGARYYDEEGNELDAASLPIAKVLKGEILKNRRVVLKNDEKEIHFNVNATPVYDEKENFLFGVLCCHDVTEMVLHEKEILLQREQLETIIETISDMAMLTISDGDGNFLRYSKSATGYFSEDVLKAKAGSTYKKGMFFNSDGSEIQYEYLPVARVLRGEKVRNYHWIMKSAKQETHFLFNGTPIYDKNGRLVFGIYFTLDITEQVLHERLIPVAEKLAELNELKSRLFTAVAHDIREPLAAMVSLTELLEEELESSDPENMEIVKLVKEQVHNTSFMVENLLEWFKSQKEGFTYRPSSWQLSAIIGNVLELFRIKAEIKSISIIDSIRKDIRIFADREMLELVLRNLLSNAIKYTGIGGQIILHARSYGEKVILSVQDTGIGIDPEKAETLFCAAHAGSTAGTMGEKGMGLGLLISKEFVQRNGGELWVESMPGSGSTFFLSVPAAGKTE